MNLKNSEKKENNELELVVEVSPEELEAAVNKAFLKNRKNIAVPGFRKGKAPRKIIERMYGMIFHNDALDELLPEVMSFVLEKSDEDIVGYPKVNDIDLKEDNAGVDITILAALRPDVKLGKYKGLKAQKPTVEVLDSEVDSDVEATRTRNARIEKVDRAAKSGDIAIIDFEGYVDDKKFDGGTSENHELELGSDSFIPGFEDKVIGMNVGESKDIDLVFPEEYVEHLAGKPVVFKVTLNEVKEKILPELDDEFAKDVSEFDTLDEYKQSIRDRIQTSRQGEVDKTFENLLMEQLIDTMEADIPESMIDVQLDKQMDNMNRQMSQYGMQPAQYLQMIGATPEAFRERMRESSEQQVKMALALRQVAELEKIEISDAEIDAEYDDVAKSVNMELDKVKESLARDDIINDLKLRAAVKFVVDNAIAEDFVAEEDSKKAPASGEKKVSKAKKDDKADKDSKDEKKETKPKKKAPAKKAE